MTFPRSLWTPAVIPILQGQLAPPIFHVTGLEIGAAIHISHVNLPEGAASAITDRDFTIATIIAPSSLKSQGGDAETAAG